MRPPSAIISALLSLACLLPACSSSSHFTSGAALRPGDTARLRLVGPPLRVEVENIGRQAINYTITDGLTLPSTHALAPGSRTIESRHADELTLVITNPGPFPAQVMLEARSRHGFQFDQPESGQPVDVPFDPPTP